MIDVQKCFWLYLSVKTHFTNQKYNAVKMNGRIKAVKVETRKDYGLFLSLSKKFGDTKEAGTYFIANMVYGNQFPLTDFDAGQKNVLKWRKYKLSRDVKFGDDIDYIMNRCSNFNDIFGVDNNTPILYTMAMNGRIDIQTLCYINAIEDVVTKYDWMGKFPLWRKEFLTIKKAADFTKPTQNMITKYNEFVAAFNGAIA